LIMP
jgi:hypothetical protein